MDNLTLIESFSEFKDDKLIDRVTLMAILEEVFRSALRRKYGDDENLADVFVYYYGGKWTNYYKLDYLPEEDRKWVSDMIDYCEVYQEAVSALTISS